MGGDGFRSSDHWIAEISENMSVKWDKLAAILSCF